MRNLLGVILIATGACFAQAAPPASSTQQATQKPAPPQRVTVANPAQVTSATAPKDAADLPPTAPVIVLKGFCPTAPKGTDPKSDACITIITKAQFEKLVDTVNPKLPPQARQSLANDYAKMLVLSNEAKKRGLQDTQHFRDFMAFMKLQVASQELIRNIQEKTKPTAAEIQRYYDEKKPDYEEISLKRVFIPRNSPTAKPDDKKPTDDDLKAEGLKVRERLAKGEDFDAVQKDVYTTKGYTTPPPPTSIPDWRQGSVPPSQKFLFDLKQGELSDVSVEAAGAYVYRVEEKKTIPLDAVKTDIETQLSRKKIQDKMDALISSAKPEFNPAYFHGSPGPDRMIGPAGGPSGMLPPHPTPKTVPVVPNPPAQKTTPPSQ